MDKTTTKLCKYGSGNFGYARVLVEINSNKELKEKVEVCYKSKDNKTICSKFVNVEYSWKPPLCSECKVFGHINNTCGKKDRGPNENGNKADQGVRKDMRGFRCDRRSANKFAVLKRIEETDDPVVQKQNGIDIVNKYVMNQRQPTIEESKDWTGDIIVVGWKDDDVNLKCLEQIEVEDLNCSGIHYTWVQSRQDPSSGILKKINRVMGNTKFMSKYINSHVVFLPHLTSDHSPAILYIPKMMRRKKKAFRFSNFVADKLEFINSVQEKWNINLEGHSMFKLVKKLKAMKFHLKNLRWKYGDIYENDEEKMLFQRAKIKWLSDGDKNSKFFHTVLKVRAHKSRIERVQNENGESFEDAKEMIRSVNDKEIKEALYDICDNNCPGPYGYTAKFYKNAWTVVGSDVCEAVSDFFKNGKLLGKVNATLITLVPKSTTPIKVSDYRPIACCNVLYKIISKILTNRIKSALCKIISPSQSTFIPGRQITDSILLTQELLKGYSWKSGARRMIKWIMVCVRIAAFTINVNNERVGYFKGGRFLRQGDLISPYIFTLVMEVFTLILHKQISKSGSFKYHWGCKDLQISHLCFADDLLVLCHGDFKSIHVVKSALDIFSSVLGLRPNIGKSAIIFGNVKEQVRNETLAILPFKIGSLTVTYLGVPLITKSLTFTDCKCLIDKVKEKVSNWKNKLLSYAGRLQLITSILSSMQVYRASVFILPKSVIKEINKLLKGFLWCQGELSKGKAKVTWKQICRPKDEGDMGIKSLEVWNEVLMTKHLWNVATLKESLWVKWTNINRVRGESIWIIDCDKNASQGWKQILKLRDKMRNHIISKIGDGSSVFLWHDKWWGPDLITKFIPLEVIRNAGFDSKMKVKDMVHKGKFLWCTKDQKYVSNYTNRVWYDWKIENAKVDWHKVIWFSNCTPKHSFIMWIAILGRLTTQERLQKWYPEKQMSCTFCGTCPDSTNHLFFECSYLRTVWSEMKKKAEFNSIPDKWEEIVAFMTKAKHKRSIKSLLRRITLAACVYFIWCERNKRFFTGEKRCSKVLIEEIILHLRIKLASLNVKSTRQIEEYGVNSAKLMIAAVEYKNGHLLCTYKECLAMKYAYQTKASTLYLGVPLVWLYPFESFSTLIWPWEGSEVLDEDSVCCMMGDVLSSFPNTWSQEDRMGLGKGGCSWSSDASLLSLLGHPVRMVVKGNVVKRVWCGANKGEFDCLLLALSGYGLSDKAQCI
ncbi:RNA-directed DNA polymerase, eukaryota, reverse transcriptase zinc-binding domain protein [Tanacetum coccineum]